jgi:hypothetical protein
MNATMNNAIPQPGSGNDRPGMRSRASAEKEMREMAAVDSAKSDLDNVNVFTKLLKKAEEAAQSAL